MKKGAAVSAASWPWQATYEHNTDRPVRGDLICVVIRLKTARFGSATKDQPIVIM